MVTPHEVLEYLLSESEAWGARGGAAAVDDVGEGDEIVAGVRADGDA